MCNRVGNTLEWGQQAYVKLLDMFCSVPFFINFLKAIWLQQFDLNKTNTHNHAGTQTEKTHPHIT